MARSLSGTNERMTATDTADLRCEEGDFTIAGWINVATYSSYMTVFNKGSTASLDVGMYLSNQSTIYPGIADNYFGDTAVTTLPSTGTWWHFAWTRAGSSNDFYVNGSNYKNFTLSTTRTGNKDFKFGEDTNGGGSDAAARYAEWGVWKGTALTAAEVSSLAAAYAPILVRPSALTAYWPFMGRTSPEIELMGGYSAALTGTSQYDHPRIIYPHRRGARRFTTAAAGGGVFPLQHIYRHVAGIGA